MIKVDEIKSEISPKVPGCVNAAICSVGRFLCASSRASLPRQLLFTSGAAAYIMLIQTLSDSSARKGSTGIISSLRACLTVPELSEYIRAERRAPLPPPLSFPRPPPSPTSPADNELPGLMTDVNALRRTNTVK